MTAKDLPILDAPWMSGAAGSVPKAGIGSLAAPPELSQQAKEHFARVNAIASAALSDLEAVHEEIGKLRDEITLRAHMLGEATIEFEELARTASQGYGSIRKALDMVRQKFAGAMTPIPTLQAAERTDTPDEDQRSSW